MAIYHCSIKIISRTGGKSAVASAAYRAGEKLYNDETGLIHDFTHKGGVIMNEILLPKNAPMEYQNRETLWNEVQKIEKRSDAQMAREVEVALPVELTREEQIACVRVFVKENFVNQGMIADWALHDKGDGNPHAHIMLTVRELDEGHAWMAKQRTVFANARDEYGRAIYNPNLPVYDPKDKETTAVYRIPVLDENGNQKTRVRKGKGCEYLWEKISISLNDWNDHSQAEKWRASWADHCNHFLSPENQIDHRSYERQGVDKEPTIHEGVTARNMERDGNISDRCETNRMIREQNSLKEKIRELSCQISELILQKARELYDRFRELGRSVAVDKQTGRTVRFDGRNAGGERTVEAGEESVGRAARRVADIKRAVAETERDIEETDHRIAELKKKIDRKGQERNERLQRLRERRADSGSHGGDAGTDRRSTERTFMGERNKLRAAGDDINAFIASLDAKERGAEEKRYDSIAKRADREAERERRTIEEERKDAIRRKNYSRGGR